MSPVDLLRAYVVYWTLKNFVVTENLREDVVKTAQVAFQNASDPAFVCSAEAQKCNDLLQSLQVAGLMVTNWSLEGFQRNLNRMNRQIILKYDVVVLILQQNFEFLAKLAHNLTLVHSQASYIIVEIEEGSKAKSARDCCRAEGKKLFRRMWLSKRIHRSVVLRVSCPGFALTGDLFSSNKTRCMRRISTEDSAQLRAVFTREIGNMNGEILRVSMTPVPDLRPIVSIDSVPFEGVDATILREFVRYLNCRVDVRYATNDKPYTFTFPNGTMIGAAVDITSGVADMIFNGNFMYYLGSTPAQLSKWYKEDALCAVVKKAGRVPRLITYFYPLSQGFIWAVFAMLAVVGGLVYGIRLVTHTLELRTSSVFDGLATAACFMIESPASHQKRSNSERILLASCSIWAIVVLGTYQGALRGSLAIPKDMRDINTLEELADSGIYIYTSSENLLDVFSSPGNPAMDSLVERTILMNNTLSILEGDDPMAATISRQETAYLRVRPNEHLVPDCKRRSQLAFTVRIGSPLLTALDKLLTSFCEAGIIQFLLMSDRLQKEIQDKRLEKEVTATGQLTLADVQAAFVLLAAGSVFNTIVLCLEVLDGRKRHE